jgi:hypothetical protein
LLATNKGARRVPVWRSRFIEMLNNKSEEDEHEGNFGFNLSTNASHPLNPLFYFLAFF